MKMIFKFKTKKKLRNLIKDPVPKPIHLLWEESIGPINGEWSHGGQRSKVAMVLKF